MWEKTILISTKATIEQVNVDYEMYSSLSSRSYFYFKRRYLAEPGNLDHLHYAQL